MALAPSVKIGLCTGLVVWGTGMLAPMIITPETLAGSLLLEPIELAASSPIHMAVFAGVMAAVGTMIAVSFFGVQASGGPLSGLLG